MSPVRNILGTASRAIRLGRPLFLVGGVVLHALGVAAARFGGATIDLTVLVWGQVAVTATQLVTHYSNEVFDLEADRATRIRTPWSGGSRVLADGGLPARLGLALAGAAAAVAVAAGMVLTRESHTGPWTLPLILLAIGAAWSYSAPPLRLHARSLGEIEGALLLAGLTPLVGYYLQGGRDVAWLAAIVAPLVCLQAVMLIAVSLPDVQGDVAARKRTWAVRWGIRPAGRLAALLIVAAYGLLPVAWWAGSPAAAVLAVLAWAPLAAWQAWRLWHVRPARADWASLGFWSIGLVVGPSATVVAALLVAGP